MPFHFVEGITTADIAFEASGVTLHELFESAANALEEVQVDRSTVGVSKKHTVSLSAQTVEELLFSFLEELVYIKDAEQLLFSKCAVNVQDVNGHFALKAICAGERLHEGLQLRTDIKAVTLHHFCVEKTISGWKARVVIDI